MKRKNDYRIYGLAFIVALGLTLRILQWNDYLIYPDSYSYLTANGNILACTKVFYCTIVNLFTSIFENPEFALRTMSLVLSTLSIILVYFVFEKQRRGVGVFASFLFAVSFSICSWTNFILPDFLAIFLLLLFLLLSQSVWSGVVLLLATLTRPEYAVLLPIFATTIATDKKVKVLLYSFFAVAIAYYFALHVFPFGQVALKAEPLAIFMKLIEFDPLLSILSIAGLLLFIIKPDRWGHFFAGQLIVFSAIYIYNNPLNWRYGIHLVLPLIYFGVTSIDYLIKMIKRGKSIYDYVVIGVLILLVFQIYITSFGVRGNIPKYNYESFLIVRSDEIAGLTEFSPRRIGTAFSEVVKYEVGREGFNPLGEPARTGDLLIIDSALVDRGYELENTDHYKLIASFDTSMFYYSAGTVQLSGNVFLYEVR